MIMAEYPAIKDGQFDAHPQLPSDKKNGLACTPDVIRVNYPRIIEYVMYT